MVKVIIFIKKSNEKQPDLFCCFGGGGVSVGLHQNVYGHRAVLRYLNKALLNGSLDVSAGYVRANTDIVDNIPFGHRAGLERLNAGEGKDVILQAILIGVAVLFNDRPVHSVCSVLELTGTRGGRAEHSVEEATIAALIIVRSHHTDADISIICAGVDHIGALGKVTAGNHVFSALADVFGVFLSVRLDFVIGERLEAVGGILHAAGGLGGIGDGGIAGVVVALAVVSGFDQINLDVSHSKRIGGRLGVGEVSKRCAHNGDRQQGDAEAQRGNLLLHVLGTPSLSN